MKQLAYIFTALLFLFTACSQDENNSWTPDTGKDEKVTVNFNLSLKDVMYSTDYVPMRAAGDEVFVSTERQYKAILFKKFDNYWVIDSLLSLDITDEPGYGRVQLSASTPLKSISLTLRPGDYHLTLITNPGFVNWKPYIFEGSIIEINDEVNPQPLCGYMIGTESYPVDQRYYLGAEIFSGHTSFTVEKQDTLHGQVPAPLETIEMKRRVGRFRIVLQNDPSTGDRNFGFGYMGEQVVCEMTANNDVFCNGLDLWGNPYYDPSEPITQMMYSSMSQSSPVASGNGESYFIPSANTRIFATHFFTQPGRDIEFTLSDIESTVRSGDPYHIYIGEIPGLMIQDNTINGIVFKPGPKVQGNDYETEMILVTDENGDPVSSLPLFSPSAEYLH